MITGTDGSMWTIINDPQAWVNDAPPLEFKKYNPAPVDIALWRGYDGWRDDIRFVEHRKQTVNLRNQNGNVLWGAYMFLGYSSSVGSVSYTASRGDEQYSNFWSLITAGGIEWQVPPALDLERNSFRDSAGVTQYMPLPPVKVYADEYLIPAISKAKQKTGRLPILYTSPDIILHYLAPLFGLAEYAIIFECPLWVADYNPVKADGSYVYETLVSRYFPKWLIHQNKGSVKGWPGVTWDSNIDLNRCQGTRAQWKAWCADATAPLPQDDAPDPGDPPVDPPVPPVTTIKTGKVMATPYLNVRMGPDVGSAAVETLPPGTQVTWDSKTETTDAAGNVFATVTLIRYVAIKAASGKVLVQEV